VSKHFLKRRKGLYSPQFVFVTSAAHRRSDGYFCSIPLEARQAIFEAKCIVCIGMFYSPITSNVIGPSPSTKHTQGGSLLADDGAELRGALV